MFFQEPKGFGTADGWQEVVRWRRRGAQRTAVCRITERKLYGVKGRRAAVSREAEREPDLALIFAAARSARNRANHGNGPEGKF